MKQSILDQTQTDMVNQSHNFTNQVTKQNEIIENTKQMIEEQTKIVSNQINEHNKKIEDNKIVVAIINNEIKGLAENLRHEIEKSNEQSVSLNKISDAIKEQKDDFHAEMKKQSQEQQKNINENQESIKNLNNKTKEYEDGLLILKKIFRINFLWYNSNYCFCW